MIGSFFRCAEWTEFELADVHLKAADHTDDHCGHVAFNEDALASITDESFITAIAHRRNIPIVCVSPASQTPSMKFPNGFL